MTSSPRRRALAFLLATPLAACGRAITTPSPAAPAPARPPATLMPVVSPAVPNDPAADSGWLVHSAGIEVRQIAARADDERATTLLALRLDPAVVRLRVRYQPEQSQTLAEWFAAGDALAMINGGFFGPDYTTSALLVSDGVAAGETYAGFGGMLRVEADGAVSIQVLRDAPFDAASVPVQAIQSFPVLVFAGGVAAELDAGPRARRSAIAIDRQDRVLLLVCGRSSFSLPMFARWLAASDLAIERALNLDGGSSTGMYLAGGPLRVAVDSFGPLPIVLAIEGRP